MRGEPIRPQVKPTARPKPPHKGLARKSRLRRVGNTSHARRPRDFEYMGKVKQRPCLARLLDVRGVGCQGEVEAHHMFGRYGAESDRKCVPLCSGCHRHWHNASGPFAGWGKERRRVYALWSVEFTQLEIGIAS